MIMEGQLDEIAESARIWHYTSFPALLSILQRNQLWFTRLDKLEDPWEGRSWLGRRSALDDATEDFERKALVHCWHIADGESDVMWKVHAPAFGVAVQSTVGRFKKGLLRPDGIRCAPVRYGTDWNRLPPARNAFQKRRHFQGEREFRAHFDHEYSYDASGQQIEIQEDGRYIDIDPGVLIEEVWVSPHAPTWFCDVLQTALSQHGYSRVVMRRPA